MKVAVDLPPGTYTATIEETKGTDITLIAVDLKPDLMKLHQRLNTGMFFSDYDEDVRLMGVLYTLIQTMKPKVDPQQVEQSGKRWHGTEYSITSVRYEPYKPDGQRQTGMKGRWQRIDAKGDFFKWQNTDQPQHLTEEDNGRSKT